MLRHFVLLAGLWPSALAAQTDVVGLIESEGLRAAQIELAALPDPAPTSVSRWGPCSFSAAWSSLSRPAGVTAHPRRSASCWGCP